MAVMRCEAKLFSTPASSLRRLCFKAAMCLAVAAFAGLGSSMSAQEAATPAGTSSVDPLVQRNVSDLLVRSKGVPDDWTHHYLVFSNPGTEADAIKNGTYDQWLKVANDPRYALQLIKRSGGVRAASNRISGLAGVSSTLTGIFSGATGSSNGVTGGTNGGTLGRGPGTVGPQAKAIKLDWNVPVGGTAASTVGTITGNDASGTSTVTIDGQTITGSLPTAASATGTFTAGAPGAGQTITITNPNNSNVLTLSTNATTQSSLVTVGALPTSTTVPTLTITNSAGASANALVLTTNATSSSVVGTVDAVPTSTSAPTLTMTNTATSNTLTMTTNATVGTASGTVSIPAPSGWSISITNGALATPNTFTLTPGTASRTTYTGTYGAGTTGTLTFKDSVSGSTLTLTGQGVSNGCTSATTGTFETNGNGNQNASYLATALANCYASYPTTVFVTAAYTSGDNFTVYDTNLGSSPTITFGGTGLGSEASFSGATPGSNGSQTCTSSTAGTFAIPATVTTANEAANIAAAISACATTYPNIGITVGTVSGSTIPITENTPGAFLSISPVGNSIFTWSAVGGNSAGTNACTSATTGTFATSNSTATIASNIATAINSASCQTTYPVGLTANYTSGSTFTVKNAPLGPYLSVSGSNFGTSPVLFGWGTVTAGSLGTNACTSSTVGTFATGTTTAAVAQNIATAITNCNTSYPAVGLTQNYASGNTFTVSDSSPGPYLTVLSSTPADVSFGTTTGGAVGSASCNNTTGTFEVSNVAATEAGYVAAAIQACTPATVGVDATSGGTTLNLVAGTLGAAANNITLAETMSDFGWNNATLVNGTNGTQSGTTFVYWGGAAAATPAAVAASIAQSINANSTLSPLVTATSGTSGSNAIVTVTADTPGATANSYATAKANFTDFSWTGADMGGGVSGARVQPNMYPAKFSFSTTSASCSDYVVYPTGTQGGTLAPSIVAFDNLYPGSTCLTSGGTAPVSWSYNTGGMATTSPVLSLDGTQVAFVQVNSSNVASLVILKPLPNDVGTTTVPVTLTSAGSGAAYQSCTAPCMYVIPFHGSTNDTYSMPYYSYDYDQIFVGDDSGNLHEFTGVFLGSPAETVSSPWPVAVATNKLSSPVYDNTSGLIFVGCISTGTTAQFHSINRITGAMPGESPNLGDAIIDAPLVDSSAGVVYTFVTTGLTPYENTLNLLAQFVTGFTSVPSGYVALGTGGTGDYLYAGTFDNVYYNGTSAHTGNIYVMGNTGGTATLYRVPISNSSLGAPVAAVSSLSSGLPFSSPMTEFCNGGASACTANGTETTSGTDYIFFSVYAEHVGATCSGGAGNGCVFAYTVNNNSSGTATPTRSGETGATAASPCWVTSGLVVDSGAGETGDSEVYYIQPGTNGMGGVSGLTSSTCTAGTATTMGATQSLQTTP